MTTLRAPEELDALPVGQSVWDRYGETWVQVSTGRWYGEETDTGDGWSSTALVAFGPFTVKPLPADQRNALASLLEGQFGRALPQPKPYWQAAADTILTHLGRTPGGMRPEWGVRYLDTTIPVTSEAEARRVLPLLGDATLMVRDVPGTETTPWREVPA